MKVRAILSRVLLTVLSALFVLSSCQKEINSYEADEVLDKNLLKNGSKYSEALSERSLGEGAFSIEDIKRSGDNMRIHVKGGCSAADYLAVWDGAVMESYPMQIRLVLLNESEDTDCDASARHIISVNLTKIIGKHRPEDYVIHIANGSAKEDKSLNPDGSVSLH